jgi:acetyltransferase-like isoleucine patch superfamily enzyme
METTRYLDIKFAIVLFVATRIRKIRAFIFRIKGYDISISTIIEGSVKLDKLYPQGIHIGENTLIAGGTIILSHDHCKRVGNNNPYLVDTYIGKNCFIAVGSIILPGVKIGNEVIVGAGSVVTKNVPSNCIVAGNPAKVIRENIKMNDFAALENWSQEKGWY